MSGAAPTDVADTADSGSDVGPNQQPSLARRFGAAVERRLPSRLRLELIARRDLPTIRAFDHEENARGRLPQDERIEVHSIWLVECYPPSKVSGLLKGLRDLGLDRSRPGRSHGNAVEWVIRSRGSGFSGGWLNLGYFTRPRTRLFGADRILTTLPSVVDYASGGLYGVAPSLTALVVQFVLHDGVGHELERALNRDYQTRIGHAGSSSIVYDGPSQQRQRSVNAALARARRHCGEWLSENAPGFFASDSLDHPSCTFLTTQRLQPFDHESRPDWGSYAGILGLDRDHVAWRLDEGISLSIPEDDGRRHWLVAGRGGDFFNDEMQGAYGGGSRGGWANRLSHEVSFVVAALGAESLLRDFHAATAAARDASTIRLNASGRRQRKLESLPRLVSLINEDIEPVAAELSIERDVRWNVRELAAITPGPGNLFRLRHRRPIRPSPGRLPIFRSIGASIARTRRSGGHAPATEGDQPIPHLAEVMADSILRSAERLHQGATRTREALATSAALSSAIETLRLDRRLFWLTLVLGAIAVTAALPSIVDFVGPIIRDISLPRVSP